MAPVPARASAHTPQVLSLPLSYVSAAMFAVISIFAAGIFVGLMMRPPPFVERCSSAPDVIGCIIQSID